MAQINTKEYILERASDLFMSKNYEAVTISEISKVCGLTKGALYHHYVNKEELFKDVIAKLIKDSLVSIETNVDSLKEYIAINIDMVVSHVTRLSQTSNGVIPINLLTIMGEAHRYCPGFFNEVSSFFTTSIERWETMMHIAIKNNEIRSDIDPYICANIFFGIGSSVFTNLIMTNSTERSIELMTLQYWENYKLIKG